MWGVRWVAPVLTVVLMGAMVLASPPAHAERAYFAYFHGQSVADVSFGDACDESVGDRITVDVPNDQFRARFTGRVQAGSIYIHDVVFSVGNDRYSLGFTGPIRFYSTERDVKDFYSDPIQPNQTRRIVVDYNFPSTAPIVVMNIGPNVGFGQGCGVIQVGIKDK